MLYVAKAVLLATPFVTDDFIYHAPATAHWIQAGRLTLAPQGYHAYFPLLSELFTTWFVLPFHADAFASLTSVVWMLLAAAAIGAIAARLRGSREAGLLAAMCLLVAPAILHGSESFGAIDVAVTALVLASLLFAMPRPGTAPRAADLALSGVAMGLALGCRVTVAPAAVVLAIFAWTASRAGGHGRRDAAAAPVPGGGGRGGRALVPAQLAAHRKPGVPGCVRAIRRAVRRRVAGSHAARAAPDGSRRPGGPDRDAAIGAGLAAAARTAVRRGVRGRTARDDPRPESRR